MKFINDKQRKAVFARLSNLGNCSGISTDRSDQFANMNRFALSPYDNISSDIKRIKRSDDINGIEEIPTRFPDRHHIENLEIDAAIKPLEREFGRRKSNPTFRRMIISEPMVVGNKPTASLSLEKYAWQDDFSSEPKKNIIVKTDNSIAAFKPEFFEEMSKPIVKTENKHLDLVGMIRSDGKEPDYLNEMIKKERAKKLVDLKQGRDEDETSEDYVSKGDTFSHSFSKRNGGITKVDGRYECDYCGDDFGSKTLAKTHASMCNEKEEDEEHYEPDEDDFFNGDDGDPIT